MQKEERGEEISLTPSFLASPTELQKLAMAFTSRSPLLLLISSRFLLFFLLVLIYTSPIHQNHLLGRRVSSSPTPNPIAPHPQTNPKIPLKLSPAPADLAVSMPYSLYPPSSNFTSKPTTSLSSNHKLRNISESHKFKHPFYVSWSYKSLKIRWFWSAYLCEQKEDSTERIEEDLGRARAAIRKAIRTQSVTSYKGELYVPSGCVYRNAYAFHQ